MLFLPGEYLHRLRVVAGSENADKDKVLKAETALYQILAQTLAINQGEQVDPRVDVR